jgi:hypothetical protein
MAELFNENPLLAPLRKSFDIKRDAQTGLVPRNWLLITLKIIDLLRDRDRAIQEDEIYSYDFTLKNSRAASIPKLLLKYGLPTNLGLSKEGVTVRGAPGYRMFREIEGGAVLLNHPVAKREAWILEAVEAIREEIMKVVGQKPVHLPSNVFEHTGKFIPALLEAVLNRSNGRVEQALVGSKLQLRFPETNVPINSGYSPDRQTGRECDYEVGQLRVVVSVSPGQGHFASAQRLADEGREVYLVVSEKAFSNAKKRIKDDGYEGPVTVASVADYVTSNMKEIGHQLQIGAREMCLKLVAEYNRRIAQDRDHSLQVVLPP